MAVFGQMQIFFQDFLCKTGTTMKKVKLVGWCDVATTTTTTTATTTTTETATTHTTNYHEFFAKALNNLAESYDAKY